MNNQKWFLILPIIKNQVLLTSLCHPLCAEKYQDDLRNNSCDLLTPEIHDEVNGCCQTNPDILPLRHFQLSHFPHPTVTQISSTGGALQTSAWFSQQCNKTGLLSLWRYSAEWRKGMGRVRYGGRESGWETESFHLWPTDRRCLSYKKNPKKLKTPCRLRKFSREIAAGASSLTDLNKEPSQVTSGYGLPLALIVQSNVAEKRQEKRLTIVLNFYFWSPFQQSDFRCFFNFFLSFFCQVIC